MHAHCMCMYAHTHRETLYVCDATVLALQASELAGRMVEAFNLSNDEAYRREQGRQQLHKLPNPKLRHLGVYTCMYTPPGCAARSTG